MLEQNIPVGIRCPAALIRPLLPKCYLTVIAVLSDEHNCIIIAANKKTIVVMVEIVIKESVPKWIPIRIEYINIVKEAIPENIQLFQNISNAAVNFDASSEVLLNLLKFSME